MQRIMVEQRGDAGGAHAAAPSGVNLLIGITERLLERPIALIVVDSIIVRQDGLDRDAAGDLTSGVAAHPIADNQQLAEALDQLALADTIAILVMVTSSANIRTSAIMHLHEGSSRTADRAC